MIRERAFQLTQEQVCEYAKYNVRWFTLAGLAYCRDHELSPHAYWTYFGDTFAKNWQRLKSTRDIAYVLLGNLLSLDMEPISVEGDGGRYQIAAGGVPSDKELAYFSLTRADTDAVWKIFEPIMDGLGHDYAWQRDGDRLTFTITRREEMTGG